ncbi:MAG TPA: hypothetical protein VIX41_03560 [Acidimicrobiales bacterium]
MTMTRLSASVTRIRLDGRQYLYRYTVEGRGSFPEDMLRYDSCWPGRQADVPLPGPSSESRRVEVVGIKPPTEARWHSFGWRVVA